MPDLPKVSFAQPPRIRLVVQRPLIADRPRERRDLKRSVAWQPIRVAVGLRVSAPTPLFRKLEATLIDEELARMVANEASG